VINTVERQGERVSDRAHTPPSSRENATAGRSRSSSGQRESGERSGDVAMGRNR
jgi:hypothetical protein